MARPGATIGPTSRVLFLSAALVSAAAIAYAQEQADPRTLIPSATLNAIAQHVSGAQARNHVLEMCPYERNRPAEEYQGTYPAGRAVQIAHRLASRQAAAR